MPTLPHGHPLQQPYAHLQNYGQQEFADQIAEYADQAQRTYEQLQLLQRYVRQLESQNPANSYEHKRQRVMAQRAKIDRTKGTNE